MVAKIKEKEIIPLPTEEITEQEQEVISESSDEKVLEEEVPATKEELPAPALFSVYQLAKSGSENIPKSPNPYYIIAREGLYLHRKLLIGRGFVPQKYLPETLKEIGQDKGGTFWWEAPQIPAEVCASIVAWFKHIYEKQKTEAEVLLLLNYKTLEWKVFIPTQDVSYSGVKSVYEPTDIPTDYVVVGTMHSHCNFGAFHSGTDTSDAADFDGVHLTIGKIMDEKPEIVAMVMMNSVQFTFDDISIVADFSNLEAATAPEEWDDYVTENANLASTHKPKGFELFEKYKQPEKFTAVIPYKPSTFPPSYMMKNTQYMGKDPDWDRGWGDNWAWEEYFAKKYPDTYYSDNRPQNYTNDVIKRFDADYWEEGLPPEVANAIVNSCTLLEEDVEHVQDSFLDGISLLYWKNLYLKKLADVATVLNALSLEVNYQVRPKKYTAGDK